MANHKINDGLTKDQRHFLRHRQKQTENCQLCKGRGYFCAHCARVHCPKFKPFQCMRCKGTGKVKRAPYSDLVPIQPENVRPIKTVSMPIGRLCEITLHCKVYPDGQKDRKNNWAYSIRDDT